jgi:hypothetical protein
MECLLEGLTCLYPGISPCLKDITQPERDKEYRGSVFKFFSNLANPVYISETLKTGKEQKQKEQ